MFILELNNSIQFQIQGFDRVTHLAKDGFFSKIIFTITPGTIAPDLTPFQSAHSITAIKILDSQLNILYHINNITSKVLTINEMFNGQNFATAVELEIYRQDIESLEED